MKLVEGLAVRYGKIMNKSPLDWKQEFDSADFDEQYYYEGNDLGCTLKNRSTVFKVWAPTARFVTVNIYRSGNPGDQDMLCTFKMKKREQGVWSISIKENLEGFYYTYFVNVDGTTYETQDVYTKACGVNGKRSMILDLNKTNPSGWEKDSFHYPSEILPTLYEIHIKDFSNDINSGIPEEYRGKYKAFTCKGTTVGDKGDYPTCLSYLKELGISHVHLLPTFDYCTVDESRPQAEQFNWGYDPENYNVPEGSYSTDPFQGEVRIREFKEMVMALHKAGIGVVMDVVYNHTYSKESCFQKTVPYYYYRLNEDGTFSNGSGCGNETASERRMFRKYMIDSLCYWVKEYHIDGFRFDLMGIHDVETMNEIRKALDELPNGRNILMYGEPWAGGGLAMAEGAIPAVKSNCHKLSHRIAFFNDDTRDVIKGSVMGNRSAGFINGCSYMCNEIASVVRAWCDGSRGYKPHNQGQVITYVSAHDNWTLWDKLKYTMHEYPDFDECNDGILHLNRFAAGVYMTSLGTIFLQAGEEAGRTKYGNGNSYNASPKLNQLDWNRMEHFHMLTEYYKGLLRIRKQFSAYWSRSEKVQKLLQFHSKRDGLVVFSFDCLTEHEQWKRLWVSYSTGFHRDVFQVPQGNRFLLSDGVNCYDQPIPMEELDLITVYPGVTIYGEA